MDGRNQKFSMWLAPVNSVRQISPYQQKLATQLVVWVASIVVWGSTLDVMFFLERRTGVLRCNGYCVCNFIFGGLSFLFLSMVLFFNYQCETKRMSRDGWFSELNELYMMYALTAWWIPGVALSSNTENFITAVGETFAYFAMFGSVACCFTAYRSLRASARLAEHLSMLAEEQELSAQNTMAEGP